MNEWERQKRKAEYLKKAYPPGTRIVLNFMGDDPRPIENGMRGRREYLRRKQFARVDDVRRQKRCLIT